VRRMSCGASFSMPERAAATRRHPTAPLATCHCPRSDRLVDRPEHAAVRDAGCSHPCMDRGLNPRRDRHRSDVTALANEIGDDPMHGSCGKPALGFSKRLWADLWSTTRQLPRPSTRTTSRVFTPRLVGRTGDDEASAIHIANLGPKVPPISRKRPAWHTWQMADFHIGRRWSRRVEECNSPVAGSASGHLARTEHASTRQLCVLAQIN
jgi:hypothetical protein